MAIGAKSKVIGAACIFFFFLCGLWFGLLEGKRRAGPDGRTFSVSADSHINTQLKKFT